MSESVNLPALGESVTEGTVTRWLKKVGDRVEVDEPLVEISTDKVDTEIPSPIAGVIEEILVAEDETVDVGTALAKVGDGSGTGGAAPAEPAPAQEQAAAPAATQQPAEEPAPAEQAPTEQAPAQQAPTEPAPAQQPSTQQEAPVQPAAAEAAPSEGPSAEQTPSTEQAPSAEAQQPAPAMTAPSTEAPAQTEPQAPAPQEQEPQIQQPEPAASTPLVVGAPTNAGYVTPLVRKLANEKGVDLSSITGSGVGGRIRKEDVLAAASQRAGAVPGAPSGFGLPETTAVPLETSPLRGTTAPMSRLRKVVAERAVTSMQNSAQLTTVVEADVTQVASFRDQVKDRFFDQTGVKLTFLPFFTLAAAEALRAYPIVNASVDGENIVYPPHENISIAVDTDRGLLTPVVRDAGDLSLVELASQIADLAERTRENKLKPDELAGGTFTVTNTGSRGALFDTPLVFLPQSAILGTGLVYKKPVVSDHGFDAIAIRSVVYLALSYDHRIVDGADAARFLVAVQSRLESGDFAGNLGL